MVALLVLSYRCIVTINVLWLFLTMPWVGLQYVSVVFPDHTHLLYVVKLFFYFFKDHSVKPIYTRDNIKNNEAKFWWQKKFNYLCRAGVEAHLFNLL